MKKIFLILFVFIICSLTTKAQVNSLINNASFDQDGNNKTPDFATGNKYPIKFSSSESRLSDDSIRSLTEMNTDTIGGGYPYISADGLRLYFTKSVNVVENMNLYYMSRSNINSGFSNRQLVGQNFKSGSMGCWLSNDELELFFRRNDTILHSTRISIVDPFINQNAINLTNYKDNIQGISLTPDKQELYFSKYVEKNHSYILRFLSTSSSSYSLIDTLKTPLGLIAKVGQLSKDGLKYYVTLKDTTTNITKIYKYIRNNLSESFNNPVVLNNGINNTALTNSQATVTLDENITVWIKNNNGYWGGNAFYISTKNLSTKISEISNANISIYTDLTNKILYLTGLTEKAKLSIYELSGRLVYYNTNINNNQIDLSKFQNGVYLIKIKTDIGIITKKFIR